MEVLTTVQTIADDQTEVASKMNILLSEYQIRTDDIKAYDIATFGANKFLISVIYILTQLTKLGNVFIRLQIKLARIISSKRKFSSIANLRVSILGFVFGTSRRASAIVNLVSKILRKINSGLKKLIVVNLVTKVPIYRLTVSRKISYILRMIEKKVFSAKRGQSLPLRLGKNYHAWYNGVPIQL